MKQAKAVDSEDSKLKVTASDSKDETRPTDEGLSGGHVAELVEDPGIPGGSKKDLTAEIA